MNIDFRADTAVQLRRQSLAATGLRWASDEDRQLGGGNRTHYGGNSVCTAVCGTNVSIRSATFWTASRSCWMVQSAA